MKEHHPDRLNPERTDKDVRRILELVVEVRQVWEEAVDGGIYPPRTESNARGKGFDEMDPTHAAVSRPTQQQLRRTARRAATLIHDARESLEDAATVLHNGLLRTDPEVLAKFLEKRQAAVQGR